MNVHKCDFCKKEVKEVIVAGTGFFSGARVELCDDCGAPILRFLIKHNIIKKETKKAKHA